MMGSFEWMELETLSHEISSSQNRLEAARWAKDEPLIKSIQRNLAELEERRSQLLTRLGSSVTSRDTDEERQTADPDPADDRDRGPPAEEEMAEEAEEAPATEAETEEEAAEEETEQPSQEPAPRETVAPIVTPTIIVPEPPPRASAPTVIVPEPPPRTAAAAAIAPEPPPRAAAPAAIVPEPPPHTNPPGVSAPEPKTAPVGGVDAPGAAWNHLTPADLERAKHELAVRRVEMLARHAEELRALDTDQAEIDVLERAIANFLRKYTAPLPGGEVVHFKQERQPRRQTAS